MELHPKISFVSTLAASSHLRSLSFEKVHYTLLHDYTVHFGKMESVSISSCSPEGSSSKNERKSSTKNCRQPKGDKNPTSNILHEDAFLRIPKCERPTHYLDERRDDYFAVSKHMWDHLQTSSASRPNWYDDHKNPRKVFYLPSVTGVPASRWYQPPHSMQWYSCNGRHPGNHSIHDFGSLPLNTYRRTAEYAHVRNPAPIDCRHQNNTKNDVPRQSIPRTCEKNTGIHSHHMSRVPFPDNITIPKEICPDINNKSSKRDRILRRSRDFFDQSQLPPPKKSKRATVDEGFDKLDLLCSTTLELGPLQENPTGCSCPKSQCIALYCDCFKAGRRCDPTKCSCLNCKNTVEESGPNGARSRAIQGILARNPRAFRNAGHPTATNKSPPGELGCNCIRSRCLKLYCTCFQKGVVCNPLICRCVGCLNIEGDPTGMRQLAVEMTLEKRPDAFKKKSRTKILGAGCACKNNQCLKKYCECFRTNLKCSRKCSCKDCKNH